MENWQKAALIGAGVALTVGIFSFVRSRHRSMEDVESSGGSTIWIDDDGDEVKRIVPNEKPDLDVIYNNISFEEDLNDEKEDYDNLASEYTSTASDIWWFNQPQQEEPECTLERITEEEFGEYDEYEPHSATWYPSSDILAGFDGENGIIAFDLLGWGNAIRSLEGTEPGYFKEKDGLGKYVIYIVADHGYGVEYPSEE